MARATPTRMSEAERARPLRRGWTTGACAAGAARAAFEALLTGQFPDPVPVALPKGLRPEFALATHELKADFARAGSDDDETEGLIDHIRAIAPVVVACVFEEIEPERGKLKVTVNIFGRNTPVELEYWQVEKA